MTERKFAPLTGPWSEKTNIDASGALYAVFHVQGLGSDLAAVTQVIGLHGAMNHNAMQLGHHSVEWYIHGTRVEQSGMTPLPECPGWFARRFDQAYTECLGSSIYRNDIWFTVLKRPAKGIRSAVKYLFELSRSLFGSTPPLDDVKIPSAAQVFLDEFEDMVARLGSGLASVGAQRLTLEQRHDGGWYSQMDEAYHLIANNFAREIPVSRGRCSYNITPYPMDFGAGAWSIETGPSSHRFGVIFGLKNYPVMTKPTMFDDLRRADFGFTLTNAFQFTRRSITLKALGDKFKHMTSSGDQAVDDVVEVKRAENRLASGHNVWGKHQIYLAVHSRKSLEDLDAKAVKAETILSNAHLNAVRETKALKPAYYAQLPGNRRWNTRPNSIPSEIFCDFAALHGVPRGRHEGRWGPPIVNFRTTADTEYPFHFHVQDSPQIPKEDLGSVLAIAPSGSGKTGLLGSLATLSMRQGARIIVVDKDFGLSTMVNANGGPYLVLTNDEPTWLAPLRASMPKQAGYIAKLVHNLILSDGKGPISSDEDDRLQRAVELQLAMPPNLREMAGIAVALGQKAADGARARLKKWCWGERLGWVLDCREDRLDLTKQMMGFETSSLIKNDEACSPVLNYLFHRTGSLIDGTPIAFIVDEFWAVDKNEAFSADTNDKLTTIRKNEGIVMLATQNAHTAMTSRHAHTLKQQIPTKIFFADADASRADLVDGLGLTDAEFHAVTVTLASRRHQFLVKRPGGSVICTFDLSKRPDQIALISSRRSTYDLMNRLKEQHGDRPQDWVPHFERLAPGLVDKPVIRKLELVS